MNNVVAIQTIVNENRDKMPDSTAKEITEQCRDFFVGKRTNFKVNVTWLDIVTNVNFYDSEYDDPYVVNKVVHQTQTLFVEGLNERPNDLIHTEDLLNRGQAFESWMKRPMPMVFGLSRQGCYVQNRICFINSMERLDKAPDETAGATKPVVASKKRARSKAKPEEEKKEESQEGAPKEEEDHVAQIQSIVDEQRDQLPTGAATAIMKECQKAFDNQPKLYKVHVSWLKIVPFTSPNEEDCTEPIVTLRHVHKQQTVFAEGVVRNSSSTGYAPEMLHRGQVPKSWLDLEKPIVFGTENGSSFTSDTLCIVHSMELVEPSAPSSDPNKRVRSEE